VSTDPRDPRSRCGEHQVTTPGRSTTLDGGCNVGLTRRRAMRRQNHARVMSAGCPASARDFVLLMLQAAAMPFTGQSCDQEEVYEGSCACKRWLPLGAGQAFPACPMHGNVGWRIAGSQEGSREDDTPMCAASTELRSDRRSPQGSPSCIVPERAARNKLSSGSASRFLRGRA
jgi:hypothetical protein